jgi:hypothetical protein
LSLARTLDTAARKSTSLDTGSMIKEHRRLYEADRMHVMKVIGVHNKDHAPKVEKMNHLGSFARTRQSNLARTMPRPRGKAKALARFNSGRDKAFADELVRLTTRIGTHLAQDGHVPGGVWTEFDNLNNNRQFFRRSDSDHLSQSRHTCGPGTYDTIGRKRTPPGGKLSGGSGGASRRRNEAQLEAMDRMKHRESSFRKTKDWGPRESGHLQRLYEELGRPRGRLSRGLRDYEEHLEKFAFRHIQLYPRRSLEDVKDRVDQSLRFNKFLEIGEGDYWGTLRETQLKQRALRHGVTGLNPAPPMASGRGGMLDGEDGGEDGEEDALSRMSQKTGAAGTGVIYDPTLARAPAWTMPGRPKVRTPSPPPGPAEGGSEPYDYRSIGQQITSDKRNSGGARFPRAGADGATKLTPAEQIALLEPTSTTYTPQVAITKPRVKAYPWKRAEGDAIIDHTAVLVGPGSYEHNSMIGTQYESQRRSNDAYKWSNVWTGRLPRHLEPATEKFATSAPLPSPPTLKVLHEF